MKSRDIKNDEIFLLSKKEYKKYKKVIPGFYGLWWLRSPGGDPDLAACVDLDDSVYSDGFVVYHDALAIRPALRLDEEAKIGTRIIRYEFPWIVIDKKLAIAEVPIACHSFDEESNDYESSEVRKFLFSWLEERAQK